MQSQRDKRFAPQFGFYFFLQHGCFR
jgi:hypothetical protein